MTDTTQQAFTVTEEHDGRRIDNYLLPQLKGVPKSLIYRLLRKGKIRVNKKRTKADYRVQSGDLISLPLIRTASDVPVSEPSQAIQERLSQNILYEDSLLMVLNKPAGLAVHGGSGIRLGVIEVLRIMRPDTHFLELAHRLDRDTSGCLIIAKKRSVLRELHALLRERKVEKRYHALTLGHWKKKRNLIQAPLLKSRNSSGERVVKPSTEGKEAFSEFVVVKTFPTATLVEVTLHTGKTHQIRVHAQYTGHPIAGDEKYGDRAFNRIMKKRGLKRRKLSKTSGTL